MQENNNKSTTKHTLCLQNIQFSKHSNEEIEILRKCGLESKMYLYPLHLTGIDYSQIPEPNLLDNPEQLSVNKLTVPISDTNIYIDSINKPEILLEQILYPHIVKYLSRSLPIKVDVISTPHENNVYSLIVNRLSPIGTIRTGVYTFDDAYITVYYLEEM